MRTPAERNAASSPQVFEGLTLGMAHTALIEFAVARGWRHTLDDQVVPRDRARLKPPAGDRIKRYELIVEKGVLVSISVFYRAAEKATQSLIERHPVRREHPDAWAAMNKGRTIMVWASKDGKTLRAIDLAKMNDQDERERMVKTYFPE